MKNALLTPHESLVLYVYDSKEADEKFGEDFLNQQGTNVPARLLERYKKNLTEYIFIQKELMKYYEKSKRA